MLGRMSLYVSLTRCVNIIPAVAFRIYDLDRTGDIQPSEVARLLSALLLNNPDIALDDASIQKIVDQASSCSWVAVLLCRAITQLVRSAGC